MFDVVRVLKKEPQDDAGGNAQYGDHKTTEAVGRWLDKNEGIPGPDSTVAHVGDPTELVDIAKPARDWSKGGRNPDPLLEALTRLCHRRESPTQHIWRCVGGHNSKPCTATFGHRSLARCVKHALRCQNLAKSPRLKAIEYAVKNAPSSKVTAAATAARSEIASSSTRKGADDDDEKEGEGVASEESDGDELLAGEHVWFKRGREKGVKEKNARLNFAVIKLLCVRGLSTNLVASPEWKEVFSIADPAFKPAPLHVIDDEHIPQEAESIRQKQYTYLKKKWNLTISYDGSTSTGHEAYWTCHVSTPDGKVFFVCVKEATKDPHDARFIVDFTLKVRSILFSSCCVYS